MSRGQAARSPAQWAAGGGGGTEAWEEAPDSHCVDSHPDRPPVRPEEQHASSMGTSSTSISVSRTRNNKWEQGCVERQRIPGPNPPLVAPETS